MEPGNVLNGTFQNSVPEIVYLSIKPLDWAYSGSTRTLTSSMESGGRTTASLLTCMIVISR